MTTKRAIIAGGSGFLGQVLATYLLERRWEVVVLTRSPGPVGSAARIVVWDGRSVGAWAEEFEGAIAVINLTGKSVNCRYHARNRAQILSSRLDSTQVLGEAIGQCAHPPELWINASTATIYRHTFGEAWDEQGVIEATPEAKDRFSVDVALAWEQALDKAVAPGTRKIALRMAMVLGLAKNSVFPMLRRLVRFGLGGQMGNGRQFVSWVHEADFCRAIDWLIKNKPVEGVVNLAAPNPVSNAEMMRTLRQVCGVPFGMRPARWMLEIGALALQTETELIIKSRRVVSGRLLQCGFEFQFPTIGEAFRDLVQHRI